MFKWLARYNKVMLLLLMMVVVTYNVWWLTVTHWTWILYSITFLVWKCAMMSLMVADDIFRCLGTSSRLLFRSITWILCFRTFFENKIMLIGVWGNRFELFDLFFRLFLSLCLSVSLCVFLALSPSPPIVETKLYLLFSRSIVPIPLIRDLLVAENNSFLRISRMRKVKYAI